MRVVRIICWLVLVLACALAFVRTGAVVACGIGVVVFAAPLVGWACVALAARRVSAELACATTAAKLAPVPVAVSLRNASRLPMACACAVLETRNLLTSETGQVDVVASLAPRSSAEVEVQLQSELCGRMECAVKRVVLFEPFRIFSRSIACEADRRLTVMPVLHEARLRDVYAASPLSDTTVFSPYVKGSDLSEVFGLREYEPGDELKRIHWKLSEKIDAMIVRDASLPLDNALLLFWDKHVPAGTQDAAERADTMAEVVLALMEQLARAEVSFEVASNDIPASRCVRAFVTGEEDIYEMIGQLLSSPVAQAAESGLAEYQRFFGALSCSRLLYVCSQRPYNLEALLGNREAVLLICDGGADVQAGPAVSEIHFPAGGARLALDMLGVM